MLKMALGEEIKTPHPTSIATARELELPAVPEWVAEVIRSNGFSPKLVGRLHGFGSKNADQWARMLVTDDAAILAECQRFLALPEVCCCIALSCSSELSPLTNRYNFISM